MVAFRVAYTTVRLACHLQPMLVIGSNVLCAYAAGLSASAGQLQESLRPLPVMATAAGGSALQVTGRVGCCSTASLQYWPPVSATSLLVFAMSSLVVCILWRARLPDGG